MTPRLYKAAEVCELAQLQPYVLRSWEKEFPGIGVQKTQDGPRVYRQSDVDQVRKIKQLVFGEGLTLAGARRRLEEASGDTAADASSAAGVRAEAGETGSGTVAAHAKVAPGERGSSRTGSSFAPDARARVAQVRDGLRSILTLLAARPAARGAESGRIEEYRLEPPAVAKVAKVRKLTARRPAAKRPVAKRRSARV